MNNEGDSCSLRIQITNALSSSVEPYDTAIVAGSVTIQAKSDAMRRWKNIFFECIRKLADDNVFEDAPANAFARFNCADRYNAADLKFAYSYYTENNQR